MSVIESRPAESKIIFVTYYFIHHSNDIIEENFIAMILISLSIFLFYYKEHYIIGSMSR